jgi:hypothetical protein
MRGAFIFLIIFLVSLLPLLYAGSEKIYIESTTINEGMEARVKIILDSAPKGLSGYNITVSLRNGEVADILRVEFPEWARFTRSSIKDDSIRLRAVDLEKKIEPGATNVILATVIFGNTRQGESLIDLTVIRIDDDDGNPITPSIEPGRLTVVGSPTQTTTPTTQTATEATTTQETGKIPITTVTPTTETTQATATAYTSPYMTSPYYPYTSIVIVQTSSTIYLALAIIIIVFLVAVIGVLATLYLRGGGRRKPRVLRVE